MTLASLVLRNVGRNRLHTFLTVLAVGFGLVCFLLLRTALSAWTSSVDEGVQDRIASWNRVSYQLPLPSTHVEQVRSLPGIHATTYATWVGARDTRHPRENFLPFAVDTATYFSVYDDMLVPHDQLEAWKGERRGAILGDALLARLGYKVGDTVTLEGSTYTGNLEFLVMGRYTTKSRTVDRSQFIFHWDYLNESLPVPDQNQVGFMMSRVDPKHNAEVARAIDAHFENQSHQTLSMSEQAMKLLLLSNFTALLTGVDAICGILLGIIVLILGNALAVRLRGRTQEYGVLRALGFGKRHLVGLVVGEAASIGAIGGGVGVALAYLIINRGIGPELEQNVGMFFPYFHMALPAAALGLLLCAIGGVLAGAIPALRTSQIRVIEALRKVD